MLEIGTEVTITPQLDYIYNNNTQNLDLVSKMIEYRGKKAKIVECVPLFESYILDIDNGNFFWYEELFVDSKDS